MISITSPVVLIGLSLFVLALIILIIMAINENRKKSKKVLEEIEETTASIEDKLGDFEGLLDEDDFEYEQENPLVELYRRQWIDTPAGEQKDNNLLYFLAFKQLDKEQNEKAEQEDEEKIEWTDEQVSARLDEILKELSEKTGLHLLDDEQELFELENEIPLSGLDELVDESLEEDEDEEEEENAIFPDETEADEDDEDIDDKEI